MTVFPDILSFTITNRCNLCCKMCGQWGVTGYLHGGPARSAELPPETWNRLADEVAAHGREWIGLRGGEAFLYPSIFDVLAHMKSRGLHVSMDTNGTLLAKFAEDIAELAIDNFNVSVDGPERVHDEVRGVPGGFARIAEGLAAVDAACGRRGRKPPSRCIVFTISPWSYRGLAEMPDVARALGVSGIVVVPYYWFDGPTGAQYKRVMKEKFGCPARSWTGFHHETSGVDWPELADQLRRFRENLREIQPLPYMRYADEDYRQWFADCTTRVGRYTCQMPWRLIDIQPNGDANFCVDFPDYIIGNVADRTIREVWNSRRAERFRRHLSRGPLPICHRCGAKYMAGGEPD